MAIDSVLHQQQRVLERRREAREASRAQREVESRAAAGLGGSHDELIAPTQRPPAPRNPSVSGSAPRRDSRSPGRSSDPGMRYSGEWSEAGQGIDESYDMRDTIDERPPMRSSRAAARDSSEQDPRRTKPLSPAPDSNTPLARTAEHSSSHPPNARAHGASYPPGRSISDSPAVRSVADAVLAAAQFDSGAPRGSVSSARSTLLESSGLEQQRRDLLAPQRTASGRPIPSVRDWRNPSRPPPAADGFDIETPFQPLPAKARSSRPPAIERDGRGSLRAPALDGLQHIDRALELCAAHGASDYHLHSGSLPRLRIDGRLHTLACDEPVTEATVENILAEALGDAERMQLTLDGELRVIHESESGIRARLQAFVSEHGPHLQLHVLPLDVPSPEQLGLSMALRALLDKPWGLAICSGPSGSGVTTTLWSLAQALCAERARHIVSLESPIELNVQCGIGLFEQREVARHVESFAAGIQWALAEGADVIVVGDLLAPGAFEASLQATRGRCLVLGGMRAGSSYAALRRLLCEAQGDAEIVRRELADGLRLLVHQRLVPRREPPGRVAAFEVVLGSSRLLSHVRKAELLQLA
ncbi:MAG TPA: ATPase, T2SS/T4P/T4SS family, partial [Polyangiales bacterium]|nr:ATPase, T2SS/T4P/T4SS family [Polyangiales bacterium]